MTLFALARRLAVPHFCLLAACSSPAESTPTEALCPPSSQLSYDNFAEPFMEAYCNRCHSSELLGSQRQGAPLYHDFDSFNGILAVADHVDEYAASGPAATNTIMPPDGDSPSLAERQDLGEWLACEVEKLASSAR